MDADSDQAIFVIKGLKEWAVWPWHQPTTDIRSLGVEGNPIYGSLMVELVKALERDKSKSGPRIKLSEHALHDLEARMQASAVLLKLEESGAILTQRFLEEQFIKKWVEEQCKHRRKKTDQHTSRKRNRKS